MVKRLSAIKAIGLLGDKDAVGTLEAHLAKSEDPLEMTAVLDALNQIAGDNLFRIIDQFEHTAEAMKQHGTGHQTQLAQAAITEALSRFIKEQEEKSQQGQGQGKGKKRQTSQGQQPGQQSGSASGKGQGGQQARANSDAGDVPAGDSSMADVARTAGVVWGNLPPAVQEEVTAALKQELPERYKHLLKIYYKILAEGK
jgi:HEAT repeat protein